MHGHDQHSALRREQPPRAAASAFDEVLDRVAALQQLVEVGVEHGGVQPVALEAAPQEECAAAPQYRTDDGKIEIDAGSNVRRLQTLFVKDVPEQQVVEVAAVAGYVDHFLILCYIVHALGMGDVNAVIDARPQPAQHAFQHADRRIGNIRRDFVCVAARIPARFLLCSRIAACLAGDCLAYSLRPQYLVHERTAIRQVRSDGSGAPLPEMHAQDSRDLPKGHLGIEVAGNDGTQRQRLAESQQCIPAEQQGREKLAGPAGDIPVLREQKLEHRVFFLRRPAPVDRNRNQQQLLLLGVGRRDQPTQPG